DEVEDRIFDSGEERPARGDAIPSDLRHGKPPLEDADFSRHETESSRHAHLARRFEEQLMADTDAEQRCAGIDRIANGRIDPHVDQPAHRRGKTATPGSTSFSAV